MKHFTPRSFLLLAIGLFSSYLVKAAVISFEDAVPVGWSVTNGNLSISQYKAKLGSSSLKWDWNGGSVLTAEEATIQSTSAQNNGGITVWIYNTISTNDSIMVAFHNSAGERCRIPFRLNFVGWRCLWARYREDMGLLSSDRGTLTTMVIHAPQTGNGTVYFDYLEFVTNVSWEKISNFQYNVKESAGIESFLTVRNIPAPAPVPPTDEQRTAFQTIGQRLDEWYYGSGQNTGNEYYQARADRMNTYISRGVRNAPVIAANGTVNNSGLFPHYLFHNKTVDGIKLYSSRNLGESCMIQLAYDYKLNNNTESLNKALELLDYYYDQGWADGSGLGSLRMEMLRSAGYFHSAYMLRDDLGAERSQILSDAFHWFTLFGKTYVEPENPGDLADYIRTLAVPKLFYALTLSDEGERTTAMNSYKSYLDNAFKHAQGFLGSLKPDGSGYHHHAPYYSAYYNQVVYVGCFLYYILHDTPFALSEDTYQNLKQALLAYRFFSAEYNVPGSTGGRFPHQTEILQQLIPAFAFMSVARPDAEIVSAFKRLWNPEHPSVSTYITTVRTDICYTSTFGEIDAVVAAANLSGEPEANPVGTQYFPFSGLFVARQNDWTVTIKGFSKHIWDYESSGTENLYGRYLSYDHIEYTDLVNGYRSFQLTKDDTDGNTAWDWNLLPGTTTKYLSKENLSYLATDGKHRNFSDQPFLGGIGFDETTGMFTNRLHDNAIDTSFYADKSVFVFDNAFYCMGSGIRDNSTTTPFYTTLFQNKKEMGSQMVTVNGEVINNDVTGLQNPVIGDNFGNTYIINNGTADVKVGTDYLTAMINLGEQVNNAVYNYTWLVQPTQDQVNEYQGNSPVQVLRQDASAHAVYHSDQNMLAASIFQPDVVLDINEIHTVNLPVIFMMKRIGNEYEVAFSNPDMNRPSAANNDALTDEIAAIPGAMSEIVIQLNGVYNKAAGDNSEVIVSVEGDITTLTYPSAHDGETYRVRLSEERATKGCIATNQEVGVRLWKDDNYWQLSLTESREYDWTLMDVSGKPISSGKESGIIKKINNSSLPSGVYFLKLIIENNPYVYKLIK